MIAFALFLFFDYVFFNPGFTDVVFLIIAVVSSFGLYLVVGDLLHKLDK